MLQGQYLEEQKKNKLSATGAICLAPLVFLYIFCIIGTLFRVYNIKHSIRIQEQKNWERKWKSPKATGPISCDRTHFDYDICYLNRPTILDPMNAIFFTVDPTNSTPQLTEKINPYPRILNTPVYLVRQLTLTTATPNVSCAILHTTPALVFSAGGWTGNYFHDFNEKFIPLFITVDTFFPDHDFVLGIFNCSDWWLRRYIDLLSSYTRHRIINLDQEMTVHCFPSVIVGLVSHGPANVDPTLQRGPHQKTLRDFRSFVVSVYSRSHASSSNKSYKANAGFTALPPPSLPPPWKLGDRPRLVFMNRKGSRRILNINSVQRVAERVGFDAVVLEPTQKNSVGELFRLIDSSHVLVGVHGAALTNILFLRPGSVFIQMIPPKCGWLGNLCFGKMAVRLGLQYMVYDIGEDESKLELDKSRRDSVAAHGVSHIEKWAVYREQLINLDLVRVERYLERAYKRAKIFMHKKV